MCGYRGDEAIAAAVIEEADWPAPAAGDAFQPMAAPKTLHCALSSRCSQNFIHLL